MSQKVLTISELLEDPKLQILVDQEAKDKISAFLTKFDQEASEPLYIRFFIGVGAWFASLFLLIFVCLSLGFAGKTEYGFIFIGFSLLVGGILIARSSNTLFLNQVSLVMALAGNLLFVGGIAMEAKHSAPFAALLAHGFVCAIVYPFYKNNFYRFLAPLALVIIALINILDSEHNILIHFLIFSEMILFGFLITYKKLPLLFIPLMYAASLMLPGTIFFMNLLQINHWWRNFNEPLLPSSILLSGGLIYLYFNLAGGTKKLQDPWMKLAVLSTVTLGFFSTPGILVAICLILVGYAFDDLILTSIAYLFLICFLGVFYYALDINLFKKSMVIMGSGMLLLLVRWLASRCQPKKNIE